MASKLDSVGNVAVAVMALASLAMVGLLWGRNGPAGVTREPFEVGDQFDLEVAHQIDKANVTLLMLVQSRCPYCTESMPFYRSLITDARRAGTQVAFVAVSLDPIVIGQAYLAEHGVTPDAVVPYPETGRVRFGGTPTLVAVNRELRVIGVWEGKLAASGEQAVRGVLGLARMQ